MKLSDALSAYRGYRADLITERRDLISRRDEARKKYEITGKAAFSEEAATLQLSIDANNEKFDANQEVLDSLTEQYANAWNAEVARQQSDPENGIGATMAKIMTIARRIMNGDIVPYSDEKKLMEYNPELYKAAKKVAMLVQKDDPEEYDSLWDEENAKEYDPEGVADNTQAQGVLPDIPLPESGGDMTGSE